MVIVTHESPSAARWVQDVLQWGGITFVIYNQAHNYFLFTCQIILSKGI